MLHVNLYGLLLELMCWDDLLTCISLYTSIGGDYLEQSYQEGWLLAYCWIILGLSSFWWYLWIFLNKVSSLVTLFINPIKKMCFYVWIMWLCGLVLKVFNKNGDCNCLWWKWENDVKILINVTKGMINDVFKCLC